MLCYVKPRNLGEVGGARKLITDMSFNLHIGMDWVDKQPTSGFIFLFVLVWLPPLYTHAHIWQRSSKRPERVWNATGSHSHISSGSSWGLRIPGTDIWSLCFSSWAWRRAASLSSRNRSVESSPANSCKHKMSECVWEQLQRCCVKFLYIIFHKTLFHSSFTEMQFSMLCI